MPGVDRSTSAATTCPASARLKGGGVHYALGYSGNGVAPSHLAGRVLAALALGVR